MRKVLLDLVYLVGIAAASPFFIYRMLTTEKYRSGLGQRLGWIPYRADDRKCLWIHGVSVGEILSARAFVAILEKKLPDWEIVLSTTTNTGYKVAHKHFPDKTIFYYPLDFSWVAQRVVERVNPSCLVLMELEIWPNIVSVLAARGIPIVLVNGRVSEKSFNRYHRIKALLRGTLRNIAVYCVQAEIYAQRLLALGVTKSKLHVTGSMKYDNIASSLNHDNCELMRKALVVREDDWILVGGSTHRGEEAALLDVYQRLKKQHGALRLILVPRHPERLDEVEDLIREKGFVPLRKTVLANDESARSGARDAVILIDTMGELMDVYSLASAVYVGGSLIPHGGQNLMEPAGLGKPIIFGPNMFNFQDTADKLLERGAAIQIDQPNELGEAIERLLTDSDFADKLGRKALQAIDEERGASNETVEILKDTIE